MFCDTYCTVLLQYGNVYQKIPSYFRRMRKLSIFGDSWHRPQAFHDVSIYMGYTFCEPRRNAVIAVIVILDFYCRLDVLFPREIKAKTK